jgi:hypothetical protein
VVFSWLENVRMLVPRERDGGLTPKDCLTSSGSLSA